MEKRKKNKNTKKKTPMSPMTKALHVTISRYETGEHFLKQATEFDKLGDIFGTLKRNGDTESDTMLQVCRGLAKVCEMLAEEVSKASDP